MFELKHGKSIDLSLINRFSELGYESYRLVPGLNVLVPFDVEAPFDPYLLNLFGCRKEQAERLESEGMLVRSWDSVPVADEGAAHVYIHALPFGAELENLSGRGEDAKRYMEVLDMYATSLLPSASMQGRVACLMGAMSLARIMLKKGEQDIGRLSTLARIMVDAGERAVAVQILSGLINRFGLDVELPPRKLFLPAMEKYDHVDPENRVGEWLLSSIYEQCIRKHAYFSYYSGKAALPLFENLAALGFMDEDMMQRYRLVKTSYA